MPRGGSSRPRWTSRIRDDGALLVRLCVNLYQGGVLDMETTWPALGSTTVSWQPVEGLLDLSRRAQRSTPPTFEAAVVPLIAGAELVLPGDLAADLDEATRLLATFDAGGAGEIAPFASV